MMAHVRNILIWAAFVFFAAVLYYQPGMSHASHAQETVRAQAAVILP